MVKGEEKLRTWDVIIALVFMAFILALIISLAIHTGQIKTFLFVFITTLIVGITFLFAPVIVACILTIRAFKEPLYRILLGCILLGLGVWLVFLNALWFGIIYSPVIGVALLVLAGHIFVTSFLK